MKTKDAQKKHMLPEMNKTGTGRTQFSVLELPAQHRKFHLHTVRKKCPQQSFQNTLFLNLLQSTRQQVVKGWIATVGPKVIKQALTKGA